MLSSRFGGHYPIASICWVPLKGIYMKSQMACEELKEYRIFEHTTVGTPQFFWRTCGVNTASHGQEVRTLFFSFVQVAGG